jgi:hypothetical protein
LPELVAFSELWTVFDCLPRKNLDRVKGRGYQMDLIGPFKIFIGCFTTRSFVIFTGHLVMMGEKIIAGFAFNLDGRC